MTDWTRLIDAAVPLRTRFRAATTPEPQPFFDASPPKYADLTPPKSGGTPWFVWVAIGIIILLAYMVVAGGRH